MQAKSKNGHPLIEKSGEVYRIFSPLLPELATRVNRLDVPCGIEPNGCVGLQQSLVEAREDVF